MGCVPAANRYADPEDLSEDLSSRADVFERRAQQCFAAKVEPKGDAHSRGVSEDRRDGRAPDLQPQRKNKDRIEDDIHNRPGNHARHGLFDGSLASEKLSESVIPHREKASGQYHLYVLPRIFKRIGLGAKPCDDRSEQNETQSRHYHTVYHSQDESGCHRVIRFLPVARTEAPRDQRGSARSDHVRDRDGDHHHRIRQVYGRQLIVVPHQSYEISVHQIVQDHDEHACDQGNSQRGTPSFTTAFAGFSSRSM